MPAQPSAPGEGTARFWAHGRTNVGESEDPFGFGLHPIPSDDSGMSPDDHSRLSSYYGEVSPVSEVVTTLGAVQCFKTYPWEFFFGQYCPGCNGIDIPPIDEYVSPCLTCGALGAIDGHLDPFETQVMVVLPGEEDTDVAVLRHA